MNTIHINKLTTKMLNTGPNFEGFVNHPLESQKYPFNVFLILS